jgi:hypothetical protein
MAFILAFSIAGDRFAMGFQGEHPQDELHDACSMLDKKSRLK